MMTLGDPWTAKVYSMPLPLSAVWKDDAADELAMAKVPVRGPD
jgi:hypothetical protein